MSDMFQSGKVQEILEDAWLNVDFTKHALIKPIDLVFCEDPDEMYLRLAWLFTRPEYLAATCKYIMNVDLLPFQAAIISELWQRKFPMLIGSRGCGKCQRDTYVCLGDRFQYINDLFKESDPVLQEIPLAVNVLGENGYHKPAFGWKKPKGKTIKITTKRGFEIEGSEVHPIRVVRNGGLVWSDIGDLRVGDIVPIDRNVENVWHSGDTIPEDLAYFLGAIIGDGGYTKRGAITFTTADVEMAERLSVISEKYFNKELRKINGKYGYAFYSVEVWDRLINEFGLETPVCGEKLIPKTILSSSRESIAAFISGLMDTDGCVHFHKRGTVSINYSSKSEKLAKGLHFLFTRFGIVSTLRKRLNKKYNRYYYHLNIEGEGCLLFKERIGFKLQRKIDILDHVGNKIYNTNIDTLPKELVLEDLLSLREKARDTVFEDCQLRQSITPYKMKQYCMSYATFGDVLDFMSSSPSVLGSEEYVRLRSVQEQHYFYDEVKTIESGESETYDFFFDEDDHSYLSGGFISHNSWLLSVYAMLRTLLMPKRKVVIVGAAFRQSKVLFDYCDVLWKNAPIMRDLCDSDSGLFKETDMCKVIMNGNRITMLPLGSGEKIRGQRATEIICDEFASVPRDIFENVIAGFGVVSSTPTDNVKKLATLKKASEMKIELKASDYELSTENQIVLSGTAYYDFNHFADYWKKWCKIIRSKGDKNRLKEVFNGEIPKDFKWQDYSVIRLPYNLLPDGVMDGGQISRSKATIHTGIFDMEFGAKFSKDSNGFFKRSLIEYCVPKFDNPIISKSGESISFSPLMYGDRNKYYVIGVDPASEVDKFSISVIELNQDHRRIVHQWTTDRKTFLEKRKQGKTSEDDFYWYAARKIRSLMEVFPCRHIAMDSQGGGIPISEALHNVKNLRDGEVPIWPTIDPLKEKPTDGESGLHILEMCSFSDSKWLSEANHGLRFDFEQRSLIFPTFDPLVIGFAAEDDMATGRQTDTLEELIFEIEELKNELSIIEITQTAAGRDKWDTPEVKTGVGKKGRLRKDRYSSLVMANMAARQIQNQRIQDPYESYGGFSSPTTKKDDTGKMFIGPAWFTEKMGDVY